jgi:CRP-like cAMP-binding protein
MENDQLFQLAIFNGFSEQQLNQLIHLMEFCSLPADMVLFEQGMPAEYLYILLEGEVAIHYKPYDGPPLVIAKVAPGGVFGWSAALNRRLYSSAAKTTKACSAFRMKSCAFSNLSEHCPETGVLFLDHLASAISERMEHSHQEMVLLLRSGMDTNSK